MATQEEASAKTLELKNTDKRDTLIAIEKKYQKIWQEQGLFNVDAPTTEEDPTTNPDELREHHPKNFATMAYPYMNGTLHAGHCFTASKVEFQTGFARMEGKRALFPLGFHCTGMPIKTSADKIAREIEMFGEDFAKAPPPEEEVEVEEKKVEAKTDPTKFKATKGKAASKAVKLRFQFEIMEALGIPREEIPKFADAQYWLTYFPPLCKEHCNNIGFRVDWRRSFITTDANPYYDAFVRWQMNRLKELKKIKFGERYTIYSPKDGQPCMDHDRASGEGAGPQEYTGIKIKVLEWAEEAKKELADKIPAGANVYMVAATLRPETMYGQTCCFVGPKLDYGLYQVSDKEVYFCTERAARNMAFQGIFPEKGVFPKLASVKGSTVVGTLVSAPLSIHKEGVRVLPMETVLATKGTGVVTSVPSDSPDDYATVADLAKKAEYYGIKKEWAELEIPEIINTPSYGGKTAEFLVKKLKINSPKDAKQLAEAKELAYKEGFYQGTMLMGEFAGMPVEKAKPLVREQMIKAGEAFVYSEPEKQVMSRSNDECVVALCDQWYLDYGEKEWRTTVEEHLEKGLNTYTSETKHGFEACLAWLNQWACARSYGLGSKLPWDPDFLVESLSDSTIYMAYYTIAHFLHKSVDGQDIGPAGIKPEQMVDEVWDYIFARRDLAPEVLEKSGISEDWLKKLRREFEYFYPLDCRISGKDLVQNHLTFFLYIHIAIFPPQYWPKGIRANGHLMLNGEKMSKSTGNFLTLDQMTQKFGADACRVALADAGDGVEDANFEESVANAAILRLHTLKAWCEEAVQDAKDGKLRDGPKDTFWDKAFENEMNELIAATCKEYEQTWYKAALKSGFYEFQAARDSYRESTQLIGMHKDLVLKFVETQALLITPIAPHWAEYIWQEVLGKKTSVHNELFPTPTAETDPALSSALDYARTISSRIASAEAAQMKKIKKGKGTGYDPKKAKKVTIYVSPNFPEWQAKYVKLIQEHFDAATMTLDEKAMKPIIGKMGEMKKAMPFIQDIKSRLFTDKVDPEIVFNRKLLFNEIDTLLEVLPTIKKITGANEVAVVKLEDGGKAGVFVKADRSEEKVENLSTVAEASVPGQPSFSFENIKTTVDVVLA